MSVTPNCLQCFTGTVCEQGSALHQLHLSTGYWRPSAESLSVVQCPDAHLNGTGCRGGTDARPGQYCADGLDGPLCRLCAERERNAVYYVPAVRDENARCENCGRMIVRSVIFVVVALVLLVVAVVSMHRMRHTAPRVTEVVHQLWQGCHPEPKIKILFSFYMILTEMDGVYDLTLPAHVHQMLNSMRIGVSFGTGSRLTPHGTHHGPRLIPCPRPPRHPCTLLTVACALCVVKAWDR
jgi:hypothetical protein